MKRIWMPGPLITALLVLLSALGLAVVFSLGLENTLLAYAVYPLSAYALAALCMRVPAIYRYTKSFVWQNAHFRRYKQDLRLRERISFGITLLFCIYKAAAAAIYHSLWMAAVALYYLLLALLRQRRRSALARGILLLALTAALGGVASATIITGSAPRYPGHMIYAAAAYAFYNLGMVICRGIRGRGDSIALSAALVSIFFLQTALFAQFGGDAQWQHAMNAATGAGVFLCIAAMALRQIYRDEGI